MAKQLQLRRGTTAQHASFTGAPGEVTVDTDKKALVVHDGATAGGVPVARAGGNAAQRFKVAAAVDADEAVRLGQLSRGALVRRTTNTSVISQTTGSVVVTFASADYDDVGFFTFPYTFTIPSGVNFVRMTASAAWAFNANGHRWLSIKKVDSGYPSVAELSTLAHPHIPTWLCVQTPIISVSPGTIFRVEISQGSGAELDLLAQGTWFAIEAIPRG